MELLYEECARIRDEVNAKRKFNTLKAICIILYVIAALWVLIAWGSLDWSTGTYALMIMTIPLIILITGAILLGIYKNRFYVDYDYILISGSIRISKVINNSKRRDIISFETRDIEKIGMFASKTYEKYENLNGIISGFLSSNAIPADGKDFYYMVVNTQASKYLLVFECTETFIRNVLKFSSNKIIEEGFLR